MFRKATIRFASLLTALVVFSGPAQAALVDTPPPGFGTLNVRVVFNSDQTDTLAADALPFVDAHEISNGSEHAAASYDLDHGRASFAFELEGLGYRCSFLCAGILRDRSEASGAFTFQVDTETRYTIDGAVDMTGPRRRYFQVDLTTATLVPLFHNLQDSRNTATAQTFVVGGMDGDMFNELSGDASGTLEPGIDYVFSYVMWIENLEGYIWGAGTSIGEVNLTLTPAFAVIPLPPALPLLLSALAAVGLVSRLKGRRGIGRNARP